MNGSTSFNETMFHPSLYIIKPNTWTVHPQSEDMDTHAKELSNHISTKNTLDTTWETQHIPSPLIFSTSTLPGAMWFSSLIQSLRTSPSTLRNHTIILEKNNYPWVTFMFNIWSNQSPHENISMSNHPHNIFYFPCKQKGMIPMCKNSKSNPSTCIQIYEREALQTQEWWMKSKSNTFIETGIHLQRLS